MLTAIAVQVAAITTAAGGNSAEVAAIVNPRNENNVLTSSPAIIRNCAGVISFIKFDCCFAFIIGAFIIGVFVIGCV